MKIALSLHGDVMTEPFEDVFEASARQMSDEIKFAKYDINVTGKETGRF